MRVESAGRKIWVVRHGLRIDFADSSWPASAENPCDPPLHATGMTQARETAERLRQESIDWIFTSPFLRTVQTADLIAAGLKTGFRVEEGFAEWLRREEFDSFPVFRSLDALAREYPRLTAGYRSCAKASFPETRDDLDRRVRAALTGIASAFPGDILIVTHASPVSSIFRVLAGVDLDEFQAMSAISCFERNDEGWRVVIDRDSSHLTNPDTTSRAFYTQWLNRE
jgi:broad specificity phosphatase PhoE